MDEDQENKTIRLLIKAIAAVLVMAIGSCGAYNIHRDAATKTMIKEGANPETVRCAYYRDTGCMINSRKD